MPSIPWSTDGSNNFADMSIEPSEITGNHTADRVTLTIPTQIKPNPEILQNLQWTDPTLFELHGILFAERQPSDPGVPLRPMQPNPPTQAPSIQYGFTLPLVFELTPAYVQYLEDVRRQSQTKPAADMVIKLKLWGKVLKTLKGGQGKDVRDFNYFATVGFPETSIRIPRSYWLDTILVQLGYDETLLIEVPLPHHPTASEDTKEAAQYLEIARQHLMDEQYGEAVRHCRLAKEALTKRSGTTLTNLLTPLIGDTKSSTVNGVLLAFKEFYEAASHTRRPNTERIEFSRDDAEFAVNSFTFVLAYITRTLNSQTVTE
jgi:hypothetical protein